MTCRNASRCQVTGLRRTMTAPPSPSMVVVYPLLYIQRPGIIQLPALAGCGSPEHFRWQPQAAAHIGGQVDGVAHLCKKTKGTGGFRIGTVGLCELSVPFPFTKRDQLIAFAFDDQAQLFLGGGHVQPEPQLRFELRRITVLGFCRKPDSQITLIVWKRMRGSGQSAISPGAKVLDCAAMNALLSDDPVTKVHPPGIFWFCPVFIGFKRVERIRE